jgi:exodeoxyribonuclease VII large subunit
MEDKKKKEINFQEPVSVADYITIVNSLLSRVKVKVFGEVSGLKTASSGHLYFSLKDEEEGDIINCALWSSVYRMCGLKIEEGVKVIVSGYADIYRTRGTMTFKVSTVELAGEGALKRAYEELKKKLSNEGLFDDKRKKRLPMYPQKIGVITSLKGAAVHDFINNLGKFGFKIYLCDSRVEGQEAVKDLLKALKVIKEKKPDVLVIIRGGGSLQSLLAFDNEMLVRAIAELEIPVITGIGHHEDIPLVALVADSAESTPTAVANRLTQGFNRASDTVDIYSEKIKNFYQDKLSLKKEEVDTKVECIANFFKEIIEEYKKQEGAIEQITTNSSYFLHLKKEKIRNHKEKIKNIFERNVRDTEVFINNSEKIIKENNPHKQLQLGYAIIRMDGKILKSIKDTRVGKEVEACLADGKIYSEVKKLKK